MSNHFWLSSKESSPLEEDVKKGCSLGFLHDDGEPVQDLYMLDELLVFMKGEGGWPELYQRYHCTSMAIDRLRQAWVTGELKRITMGLAEYFRATGSVQIDDSPASR